MAGFGGINLVSHAVQGVPSSDGGAGQRRGTDALTGNLSFWGLPSDFFFSVLYHK